MFMYDFIICKEFKGGDDLGKNMETLTTVKIDAFVPNYIIRI